MAHTVAVVSQLPLTVILRPLKLSDDGMALARRVFDDPRCDYTAERGTFFEFYYEGNCVALCGIYPRECPLRGCRYLLHTDCVDASFRRKGIGKCMHVFRIEFIRSILASGGVVEIQVEPHGDGERLLKSTISEGIYPFEYDRNELLGRILVDVYILHVDRQTTSIALPNVFERDARADTTLSGARG